MSHCYCAYCINEHSYRPSSLVGLQCAPLSPVSPRPTTSTARVRQKKCSSPSLVFPTAISPPAAVGSASAEASGSPLPATAADPLITRQTRAWPPEAAGIIPGRHQAIHQIHTGKFQLVGRAIGLCAATMMAGYYLLQSDSGLQQLAASPPRGGPQPAPDEQ